MKNFLLIALAGFFAIYTFDIPMFDTTNEEEVKQLKKSAEFYIAESHISIWGGDEEVVDCICDKGYIIHGDGHRTPCPCLEDEGCKCESEIDTGDKE